MTSLPSLSKRRLLISAGVATCLPVTAVLGLPRRARAAQRITVVSYGGSYGDFVRDEFNKPFTAETGIDVALATGPDLAQVRAQVASKNIEWDVFDGAGPTILAGSAENLWEPLDERAQSVPRMVVRPGRDRMPTFMFTGGIAWSPKKTPSPPREFAQLWDVRQFPGRRGFRLRASETLEMALLADGVEPWRMYPLDVDRAFASLNRIKRDVGKWFDQTGHGVSLIQSGEVDFTYTYANRVRAAREGGIDIDFSFDQNINAINYYAVTRGSPRREAAMRYLQFVTRPDRQSAMARRMGFIPVSRDALLQMANTDKKYWLPQLANQKTVLLSDEFWRDRFVDVDKRFRQWVQA